MVMYMKGRRTGGGGGQLSGPCLLSGTRRFGAAVGRRAGRAGNSLGPVACLRRGALGKLVFGMWFSALRVCAPACYPFCRQYYKNITRSSFVLFEFPFCVISGIFVCRY